MTKSFAFSVFSSAAPGFDSGLLFLLLPRQRDQTDGDPCTDEEEGNAGPHGGRDLFMQEDQGEDRRQHGLDEEDQRAFPGGGILKT